MQTWHFACVEGVSSIPETLGTCVKNTIATRTDLSPYAALLLRLGLGVLFLAHAYLKVAVFTIPGFVGYFASLGLPAFLAYATIAIEFAGGLALVLGIYAPLVALPLAGQLVGTILLVHGRNGFAFTNPGGGWEFPALWALSLLVLFLVGDGAYALRPSRSARA